MSRTLLRHRQIRRTEPIAGLDERNFAQGRYFEADCLAGDLIGKFVYTTGLEVGGLPQVSTVDITNETTMPSVGVIVEKATATRCTVQALNGETSIVTTVPNSRYWISKTGTATNIPPSPLVGEIVILQLVGTGIESSRLLLVRDFQFIKLLP